GYRDVEAECKRGFRQGTAAAETVHHPRWRLFFVEDPGDLIIRLTGMNNKRQADLARGRDVRAENAFLDVAWAQIVVEVEPRLADPDPQGVLGQRRQIRRGEVGMFFGVVRMDPYRTPDVVTSFGDRAPPFELVEGGADGHHPPAPRRSSSG